MLLPRTARPATLALVADDFGMTEGVSRSILELLAARRLSGTGVMSTMPWARPLAGALLAAAGEADIGLHLNLTLGSPLGGSPVLAPAGAFRPFGELARRALVGGLMGAAAQAGLRDEISRQIEAFADAFGRWPDYVDGHQHAHVLPGVRGALFAEIAQREGWRPWTRDPFDRPGAILARGVAPTKALVIAGLSVGIGRAANGRGLATNRGFSGVSPFDPARDFAADFARFLAVPGPRHLVMCHPGHVDDDLRRIDPVVETRAQEHAFLAGPGLGPALAEAGLRLEPLSRPVETGG